MKLSSKARIAQFCAVLLFGAFTTAHAVTKDDTEVYIDSNPGVVAPPIIMLNFDYASNLRTALNDCGSGLSADGSNLATACPDLLPLAPFFSYPTSPGASATYNDFSDGQIDQFELIRTVIKRVIIGQEKTEKVGIIADHYDSGTHCAGLIDPSTKCSNGAYILERAVTIQPATDVLNAAGISGTFDPTNPLHVSTVLAHDPNRMEIVTKLNSMPSPNVNLKHINQSKEVYFELFRYLTGQQVYNGHNGYEDYTTSNAQDIGDPNDTFSYTITTGSNTVTLNTTNFGYDTHAESSNIYISPIDHNCQKIFMVNLYVNAGNQQNDSDTAIDQTFASGGMNISVENDDAGTIHMVRALHDYDLADVNGPNPNLQYADKQNVTSFFIVDQVNTITNGEAAAGGTGSAIQLTYDPTTLLNSLNKVFNQALSVSTTFNAAAIPVNVFNRSEALDNAYIALFQTDASVRPAWYGDVKKLKMQIQSVGGNTQLQFVDVNSTNAINPVDGRIDPNALTYWTNGAGYDITDTTVLTNSSSDTTIVTGKDGRATTRGGSGQKIPGFLSGTAQGSATWKNSVSGARQLFTQDPAMSTSNKLIPIDWSKNSVLWPYIADPTDSTFITAWPNPTSITGAWSLDSLLSATSSCSYTYATTSLSATTATSSSTNSCTLKDLASNVIAYMRGYNVNGTSNNANQANNRYLTRRWLTGDPLHSQPLPLNYGARNGYTTTNPDVRILYGNNDGYFRMLKNTDLSGNESGTEVWAFMPLEVMKIQKQLMDNQVYVLGQALPKHPYGVDGTPSVYVLDANSNGTIGGSDPSDANDVAYVFFGLRRGGRAYYAMNIIDPDNPKFMWKVTQNTPGFRELGYTFSRPVVRNMNWGNGVRPVIIFGGGNNPNKDIVGQGTNDYPTSAATEMGNAIYIVDAQTGALVWKATRTADSNTPTTAVDYVNSSMEDSIPSQVAITDSDGDGLADRIYVGDTGGRVWRADLPGQTNAASDPRGNWKITMLMDLGRHYNNDAGVTDGTYPNDRRFFYPPDVVPTKDSTGNYDAIVIGSGNREHPLGTINSDYMFMYKDRNIYAPLPSGTAALTPADLYDATSDCLQLSTCTLSATEASQLQNGWRMRLIDLGEKSLASPTTMRGVVYFSTYVPPHTILNSDESCQPEGTGYFYAIDLADATAHYSWFSALNETADIKLTVDDRRRGLASGGVASDPVYVSLHQNNMDYTGILPSDMNATPNLGVQRWQTYWYEKNR